MHLTPISPEDADAIQKLASDPVIAETTNLPSPYPAGGAQWWIARALAGVRGGTDLVFAIRDETDAIVGVVSLVEIDRAVGSASIGYWIGRPFWGRGHASAACQELVRMGTEDLGLTHIVAPVLERNVASRRVLEKAGFTWRGDAEPDPKGTVLTYEWRVNAPQGDRPAPAER